MRTARGRPATNPEKAPDRAPRGRAVTLLELVIALMVLAFCLLAVASAQIHAARDRHNGRHTTQATEIAEGQMQRLQGLRWTSIAPTNWTQPVSVSSNLEGPTGFERYALQWRIADLVPDERRQVEVRVTWDEPSGSGRTNRSHTITSVRYNLEGH